MFPFFKPTPANGYANAALMVAVSELIKRVAPQSEQDRYSRPVRELSCLAVRVQAAVHVLA